MSLLGIFVTLMMAIAMVQTCTTTTPVPPPTTPTSCNTTPLEPIQFPGRYCDKNGTGFPTLSLRGYMCKAIAQKRSDIANGRHLMSNGEMAPPASNMRRLNCNCYLDNFSRDFASHCDHVQGPYTYSHSIYFFQNETIQQAMDYAPQVFFNFTVENRNGEAFLTSGIPHFAYENAIEVGCAFTPNVCRDINRNATSMLTCTIHYKAPSNAPVYTVGPPCASNGDCDRPYYGKCDVDHKANSTGLCYATNSPF